MRGMSVDWGASFGPIHLVITPLQLINIVKSSVHNVRVHVARLGAEAGNAIAALFGGAEVDLEEWLVSCAYYGEVVGHYRGRCGWARDSIA